MASIGSFKRKQLVEYPISAVFLSHGSHLELPLCIILGVGWISQSSAVWGWSLGHDCGRGKWLK